MTAKVVSWVAPEVNEWDGGKGPLYFVNISFTDGESGSLGKKDRAKADELRMMLETLKGTEAEFGLEDRGKKNKDGKVNWSILSFPGYEPKPFTPGGGGKSYTPRFTDTPEGFWINDERVDRRKALEMGAGVFMARTNDEPFTTRDILALSDFLYEWLRHTASGTAIAGESAPPLAPLAVPEESSGPRMEGQPPTAAGAVGAKAASAAGLTPPTSGAGVGPDTSSTPQATGLDGGVEREGQGPRERPHGEGEPSDGPCPPHDLDRTKKNKGGFAPCRSCGAWSK